MNENQIPPRPRDNAEVKWGKRKWNVLNESIIVEEKLKLNENYKHFDNLTTFSSPMKYFKLFVKNELIDYITSQSNLYATQLSQQNSTRAIKSFTKSEIKSTIGIILLMGIFINYPIAVCTGHLIVKFLLLLTQCLAIVSRKYYAIFITMTIH